MGKEIKTVLESNEGTFTRVSPADGSHETLMKALCSIVKNENILEIIQPQNTSNESKPSVLIRRGK